MNETENADQALLRQMLEGWSAEAERRAETVERAKDRLAYAQGRVAELELLLGVNQ